MDEFERDAEVIGTRLSAFDREVGTEVRMPGADEVRRTVFRRQRARTRAVGVLAFAALAGMVGVVVADRHDPGGTAGPAATASAEPAASPSPEATGSPGAESPAAGSPSAQSSSPAPVPPDLRLSAPQTLTLRFDATTGVYQGNLTVTARNTGPTPYAYNAVYLGLPVGVEARSGGGVLWGGCVGAHTPGETWGCGDSNPVPARGGESTYRILITASYGHQKTALTLTGFTFRLVAYARDNTRFDDPTPDDNKVAVTLVLAP